MEWLAQHAGTISALDACVELAIAASFLLLVRRHTGALHPMALLVAAYFVTESLVSLSRATDVRAPGDSVSWVLAFELVGTATAIAILMFASRIVGASLTLLEGARQRAAEYERARHDYEQVVRHRINNPLTVIKGAAQTLEAEIVDDATRHQLRLAIIDAARVLEEISLAPERRGGEEHELDAIPHVPEPGGA
jgi:signal transduction histidine kinase